MKKKFIMKKMWGFLFALFLFGYTAKATIIPIPSTADSLEHFLELNTDMYANGDTILLTDALYIVNGTIDLYHGVTIMGDPALLSPPLVKFLDDGFRLRQDSTSVIITGLKLDGSDLTNGKTASFILRMNNIPISDSIFGYMKIENVEAWGFGGGIDLHQLKHAQYDSIIVNNVIWHDFAGEYCVDPNINFSGVLKITNSTFYNIQFGLVKNPDFASNLNNYTKIPKTFIIDHNTIYNIGGKNNCLIQINDPVDSTVAFTFTNNIVQKLYEPDNVRPFRINPSAGTFYFDNNVIYDFMPTNVSKMVFSLDSTDAKQTNVTVTNPVAGDPQYLDPGKGDFRLPATSALLTADSDGDQMGDPRWNPFLGLYVYDVEDNVYTNSEVQLNASLVLMSGNKEINWTVENGYGGTSGAATIASATGLLSTSASGKVKITATSVENGSYSDTLIVSIVDSVYISDISLSAPASVITTKDGTLDITASITPENPTDPTLIWSVSSDIATITAKDTVATIKALKNGVVTVKAMAKWGGVKDSLDITIAIPVHVDSIKVSIAGGASDTIKALNGTLQLNVAVYPDDADDKTVNWSASPSDVATVTNGLVTALKEGTVTITATSVDGSKTDQISIVIKEYVSGLNENSIDNINVFPNPANDYITLNIKQQSIISVHNVVGEMVMNKILEAGEQLDISSLANGIYFVNAIIEGKVATLRFVKE
ncbi:MAG: Ig-like domain-containing protein [Bacteroidales bacterium]